MEQTRGTLGATRRGFNVKRKKALKRFEQSGGHLTYLS